MAIHFILVLFCLCVAQHITTLGVNSHLSLKTLLQMKTQSETGSDDVTEAPVADEEAESETVPQGDLEEPPELEEEESTGLITIDYSNDQVDTTESANDAKNGIISQTMDLGYLNDELYLQNKNLENEIEIIEAELKEAVLDVATARSDEIELVSELYNEMSILSDYNQAILIDPEQEIERIQRQQQSQLEAQEALQAEIENSEDDTSQDLITSSSTLFVIGLGFLFLIFHSLRLVFNAIIEPGLKPGIYSLMVDVAILVVIWSLTVLVDYSDVLDEDRLDLNMIVLGVAIFILIWMLQGLWIIFITHIFAKRWKKHEKSLQNPSQELSKDTINYGVMRYLFINPAYLPSTSESYFNSNFNFAEYMIRALGVILKSVYTFS